MTEITSRTAQTVRPAMKRWTVTLQDMRTLRVFTVPMLAVSPTAAARGARARQDAPAEFAMLRVREG